MARPKRTTDALSASERIENAFWSLLAEYSYSKITISVLSKKAEVNHNTFYYYYENIDDMAEKLFKKNIATDILNQIFSNLGNHNLSSSLLLTEPLPALRWERAILFARSDSAFLTNIFKTAIMDAWLNAANIEKICFLLRITWNLILFSAGFQLFLEIVHIIIPICWQPSSIGN